MRSSLPSFALRVLTLTLLVLLTLASQAPAQTTVQIHDIMVAGSSPIVGTAATKTLPYSPYYGDTVTAAGPPPQAPASFPPPAPSPPPTAP